MANSPDKPPCRRTSHSLILKEGFLYKKGDIMKIWSRKYFVLTRESLCYFKREFEKHEPIGRVFLSDVVNIETEGLEKKRLFVFALHTKRRATLLQGSNKEDKESWVHAIKEALETDKEAERKDPFRRTLRRLEPGVKRVTLVRDPQKGIGCTIKNAAGHILVNRIIEDGPIAISGVLRPGDEILDIQGTPVTGLQVQEIGEIIKKAPDEFLATVRPLTVLKRSLPDDTPIIYSTITPMSTSVPSCEQERSALEGRGELRTCGSLDDVGTYDDDYEDSECPPPPVPKKTDDAFVLLTLSRALNLKASSEGDLTMHTNDIATHMTPPFPLSPPPPPVPPWTTEASMINGGGVCPLPPKYNPPQLPSSLVKLPAQDRPGKIMARCLSEDNSLNGASAGSKPKDSRSLQRAQKHHDYEEITMYADLAILGAGKRR